MALKFKAKEKFFKCKEMQLPIFFPTMSQLTTVGYAVVLFYFPFF